MDAKEFFILLFGAVAVVWVLIGINNFVGGKSIFQYVGSPAIFGIAVIILGMMFYAFSLQYYHK